jgi:hypothetical protein
VKKIFVSFTVLFFLAISYTGAQDRGNTGFSPFVSQIKAEVKGNLIRLTWVDSRDARGPVHIFRSTRPFSGAIPLNSKPIIIRYGEQQYIDDAEDMETLHYFIAVSDTEGRRYDVIIPYTNSISIYLAQAPVSENIPVPEVLPGISNLRVRQERDRVIITYDTRGPPKNVVLYRSMRPLERSDDFLNAVIVQLGATSPFMDFPVPGFPWYYAVIYEDEVLGGSMGIMPGVNATVSAVRIPGREGERDVRPMPLPLMTASNAAPAGVSETAKAPEKTSAPPNVSPFLREPFVFAEETRFLTDTEEAVLSQIVREFFEKGDWDRARALLQQYLTLPRSKDTGARARFYLGQTWYFTENYREALFEFLAVKPVYPAEAGIWIDAVLAAMVK